MRETMTPGAAQLGEKRPQIFLHYPRRALADCGRGDSRAEGELAMLALTVDWILEGRLEESRDIVARRFSRVETEDSGALRPELAARFEIIPGAPISGRPIEGKETITDLNSKWPKYQDGPRERSPRHWSFSQEARGSTPLKKSGIAMPAPERPCAPRGFRKERRKRQKKKRWPNKAVARGPFHPALPPPNLGHPARLESPKAPGWQPWRGKPFWLRDLQARRHKGKSRPKGPEE